MRDDIIKRGGGLTIFSGEKGVSGKNRLGTTALVKAFTLINTSLKYIQEAVDYVQLKERVVFTKEKNLCSILIFPL